MTSCPLFRAASAVTPTTATTMKPLSTLAKQKAVLLDKDFLSPYEINERYSRRSSGIKNKLVALYKEKSRETLEGLHLEDFDFSVQS